MKTGSWLPCFISDLQKSPPDTARRAFLLNREEKLTYNEIAERMDISVKTVEKKMSQTLRYLRKGLSDAMMMLFMTL